MQIKSSTLTGKFDFVYPGDGAFDPDKFDPDELRAALEANDMQRVMAMCTPDEEPTVFELQHLTGTRRRHAADILLSEAERRPLMANRKIAALSLVGVRNLQGPSGPFVVKPEHRDRETGLTCVAPSVMDELEQLDSGGVVTAIGAAAIRAMGLSGN